MKILQINSVYGEGSTGKILKDIHDLCIQNDIQCKSGYRYRNKTSEIEWKDTIEISSAIDNRIHNFFAQHTMFKGWLSIRRTNRFLKYVEEYSPDIIHLHNLHGSYINIPLLFKYIKKKKIPVVWTLHDCWPFTAICPHFTIIKCEQWKTGCEKCPQKAKYSSALIDNTQFVWLLKRRCFLDVENLVLVTPSNWLKKMTMNSFMREYDIETIYNGIDLSIFKQTQSDFRNKYKLSEKKIVLGVAFGWGYEKGLDVFMKLSRMLSDNYTIVLVGTDSVVDRMLPSEIISIHRTNNQKELAEIYTAADVFVNPTREEVLGLVNIEALACGTPVITFEAGGSPECIDKSCGSIIEMEDVEKLEKEIIRVCETTPYSEKACIERARQFDKSERLKEYIDLYYRLKLC